MLSVLDQFIDVFEWPDKLPSKRDIEHQIHFKRDIEHQIHLKKGLIPLMLDLINMDIIKKRTWKNW